MTAVWRERHWGLGEPFETHKQLENELSCVMEDIRAVPEFCAVPTTFDTGRISINDRSYVWVVRV